MVGSRRTRDPVTDKLQGYGGAEGPELSPDGKQILISICLRGECDIWRYEIERESWNGVTSDDGVHLLFGTRWRSIAYSSIEPSIQRLHRPDDASERPPRSLAVPYGAPYGVVPRRKVLATFEGTPATSGDISSWRSTEAERLPRDGRCRGNPELLARRSMAGVLVD